MEWMTLLELLLTTASGLPSSTYGYSEMMCGDVGRPRSCAVGATTASGETFDPSIPSAAVAAPASLVLKARYIWIRLADGPFRCVRVRLNDKMNPRWIGVRGFDLTPAAVEKLGGLPTPKWSGRVRVCSF